MIQLNDVIYAKDKNGKVILHAPFQRIYLEYGPKDQTEKKTSTVKSAGEADKTMEIEVPRPTVTEVAGKKIYGTADDLDQLEADALNIIQAKFPDANPRFKLLEYASNGLNLDMRKEQAPTRETVKKPISEDAAFKKSAEALVRGGMFADFDAALAFVQTARRSPEVAE